MSLVRKIVVIDDDSLLRGLLVNQLSDWGFEVREADSARTAAKVCDEHDPDGIVLDVDLGSGINGFQLAEALVRKMPHIGIVFLTRFPDARGSIQRLSSALKDAAYLNKNAVENKQELLEALNAALTNRGVLVRHDAMVGRPLANLTTAQLEILGLMHEGKTNLQIAEIRKVSLSAVENLANRTFRALGIEASSSNARAMAVRIYNESYGKRLRN